MPSNPLIPTPVVDKNGVLTTRHKKVQGGAISATAIPPVQAPAHKEYVGSTGTVDHLKWLMWQGEENGYEWSLYHLKDDNDSTIRLATKLMTTKSDVQKSLVKEVVNDALGEIFAAETQTDEEDGDYWKDYCNNVWWPATSHKMVASCVAAEVAPLCEPSFDPKLNILVTKLVKDVTDLNLDLNPLQMYKDRSHNEGYWRALTICALSQERVTEGNKQSYKHMVDVMSGAINTDPEIMYSIIKERGIISGEDMSHFIKEYKANAPALREGAL